ncbi:MAG: SCO family protein [Pseudomonadota bacterium]|nr:SCO family protein [Pseudomonadota bacterium]
MEPIYELGGDFTAVGTDGEFSLSDLRGSAVVMYFGFLSCTEACPESIGVYHAARKKLTEEERDQVKFVFISVDPERDTPEKLKQFESFFNGRLIVVTDTEENIQTLTKQYGVYFDLVDLEGSALQYTVDHSSRFYMVDTQGDLVTAMSHSTTPNELAAKIRQLLNVTE